MHSTYFTHNKHLFCVFNIIETQHMNIKKKLNIDSFVLCIVVFYDKYVECWTIELLKIFFMKSGDR